MKMFIYSHDGMTLGGDSVVIANDKEEAETLLKEMFQKHGCGFNSETWFELKKEVSIQSPKAIMIFNGEY